MAIDISDFTFVGDDTSGDALDRGDGTSLVPFSEVPFGEFGSPPRAISVVDRLGREVVFEGGGRTSFTYGGTAEEGGREEFVGWSYWESEDTDVHCVTPCVNLIILSPDYDEADYPGFVV